MGNISDICFAELAEKEYWQKKNQVKDDQPSRRVKGDQEDEPYFVAAIDFGTTFSGYAFAFPSEYANIGPRGISLEDVKMNKNWYSTGALSYKAPTSILVNDKSEFVAFGYEAEEKYVDPDDDEKVYLFKEFKMLLKNNDISPNIEVHSLEKGKSMRALTVFTMAIKYLAGHLINEINKSVKRPITSAQIRWVLTVPALWTDQAKQFMRKAAFKAGCVSDEASKRLIIALEPEVASYLIRQNFQESKYQLRVGQRYLVLDCGGGTNDMVLHQVVSDCKVKQLHALNGGDYGGRQVNEKIISILSDILGKEFIDYCNENYKAKWMKVVSDIELAKRKYNNKYLQFSLPYNAEAIYTTVKGSGTLEQAFSHAKIKGVSFHVGDVRICQSVMENILMSVMDPILNNTVNELRKRDKRHLDLIILVGGFFESPRFEQYAKERLSHLAKHIIIPAEPQLAVLRGAVLYGLYNPSGSR